MLPILLLAAFLPSAVNAKAGHTYKQAATPDEPFQLRIALRPTAMQDLHLAVKDLSTPGSSRYAKYMNLQDLKSYLSASNDSVSVVGNWLQSYNLSHTLSSMGNYMTVDTTIGIANSLVSGNYSVYKHDASGNEYMRTTNFTIPDDVQQATMFIYPLDQFDMMANKHAAAISNLVERQIIPQASNTSTNASTCTQRITPACIEKLYGIPMTSTISNLTTLDVLGLINQWGQHSDLDQFIDEFRPMLKGVNFTTTLVANGSNPQGTEFSGTEANLDLQYTIGLVNQLPVNFRSVGGRSAIGQHLDTIESLLIDPGNTTTLSISYGAVEGFLGSAEATAVCEGYMSLAAIGITTVVSSGDNGVAGNGNRACNGTGEAGQFLTTFPAACPYVTTVGGTLLNGTEEIAVTRFASGGGFSEYFDRPEWQANEVQPYLNNFQNDTEIAGRYNSTGRGYPDISAIGDHAAYVNQGRVRSIGGTSLSAPIISSMVSLVNDELVSAGLQPLGFLNPLLYKNKQIFKDVTIGNNSGCGSSGFPAATGWDPVTGLGSPLYEPFLIAAFQAQGRQPPPSAFRASPSDQIATSNKLATDAQDQTQRIGVLPVGDFIKVMVIVGVFLLLMVGAVIFIFARRSRKRSLKRRESFVSGTYRPLEAPAPEAAEVHPYQGKI